MSPKKLTKLGKKAKELSESSAGTGALFKEDIPKKVVVGEVWENNNLFPPQHGTRLESAAEADTLMGRLAKRMASRDMIDELNLGPKGMTGKAKLAQVADTADTADHLNEIPSKIMVGGGLHEQTHDVINSNMSDPIQRTMQNPGSTMRQQALNLAKGEAKFKGGDIPDHNFNQEQLNKGMLVEKEHTNDKSLAKQIAKGHLLEDPDYYTKLRKTGL